jgi:WD40 repeat protein
MVPAAWRQLTLDLWRVSDGVCLLRLGAHTNGTDSVDLSSDGQYPITSGIFSREIKVWHVPDLTLLLTIPNNDPQSPGLPPRVKRLGLFAGWSVDQFERYLRHQTAARC